MDRLLQDPTEADDLFPFAYVTSLQHQLKNTRFRITTRESPTLDRTYFTSFVLSSIEVVRYMLYTISAQNSFVQNKLSVSQFSDLALFLSRHWYIISRINECSEGVSKESFFKHIDSVEIFLSMWETFIVKNRIKCFP